MPTIVMNLSEIIQETPIILVIDDVRHEMREANMERTFKQIAMIDKLGLNPSAEDELNLGIQMILDAFPTLTREIVMTWTLSQVRAISDAARGGHASIVTDNAEEATSGNVQPAS